MQRSTCYTGARYSKTSGANGNHSRSIDMDGASLQDIYALLSSIASDNASFRKEFREEQARYREEDRRVQQLQHEDARQYFDSRLNHIEGQLQDLHSKVSSTQSSTQLTQQSDSSRPSFNSSLSPEEGCLEAQASWQQSSAQPTWAERREGVCCETSPPQFNVQTAGPTQSAALNAPLAFTYDTGSQAETRQAWNMPTQNPKQCPLCMFEFEHKRSGHLPHRVTYPHSHVRSHCTAHLNEALKSSSRCRYLPGFPPHDMLLINISGTSLAERWDKYVKAHTLTRRVKKEKRCSGATA